MRHTLPEGRRLDASAILEATERPRERCSHTRIENTMDLWLILWIALLAPAASGVLVLSGLLARQNRRRTDATWPGESGPHGVRTTRDMRDKYGGGGKLVVPPLFWQ